MARTKRLTLDEEQALASAMAAGSSVARQKLWAACLPMAEHVMHTLHTRGSIHMPWNDPDLIQEAYMAAGAAVDSWDPSKGRLSTHAYHVIRGKILDHVLEAPKAGIASKHTWLIIVDLDEPVINEPTGDGAEDRPGSPTTAGISRADSLTYDGVHLGDHYDAEPGYMQDPFGDILASTDAAQLAEKVHRLPEDLRSIVVLAYLEDMGVAEAAKTLGISRGEAYRRLEQAKIWIQNA